MTNIHVIMHDGTHRFFKNVDPRIEPPNSNGIFSFKRKEDASQILLNMMYVKELEVTKVNECYE